MKTKSKPKRQPKPKPDLNAVDLRILEAVMKQPGLSVRDLIPIAERSTMACWASMEKLRGLGNAVVPQVAEWIGKRIMEAKIT